MLKLERTTRDQQPNIIVNDKERFFTHSLLISFGIATAIHLVLFTLFQIKPLALRMNEYTYPPVVVQIDPFPATAVTAATSPTMQSHDRLPKQPALHPTLPKTPTFMALRHRDDIKHLHQELHVFSQIEKDIYSYSMLSIKPTSVHPRITLILSGSLANIPIITPELSSFHTNLPKSHPNCRTIYSAIGDNASGKIIWHMLKESSGSQQLDKIAEKILLNIRYKSVTDRAINGEIEIHFREQEANEI